MLVLMIPLTLWLRSFFEDHDEKMNKSQKNKENDED